MNKVQITEADKLHERWYIDAKKQTRESLPEFIRYLFDDYSHDYGTMCHAIAATAIATAQVGSREFGITGFQAGAIMWEFIRNWNYSSNKTGLKLVNYDNLLYPQYEDKFEKTISSYTWEALQKEAKNRIKKSDNEYAKYLLDVAKYEIEIKEFIEEFPDYLNNPEEYEHVGMATFEEHEKERLKVESGFKFAPDKPFNISAYKNRVYDHWVSIVDGNIPFGFTIDDEN